MSTIRQRATRGLWRASSIVGITAVVALAANGPAAAGTLRYWKSQSAPLIVKNEGGTKAGAAYGDWQVTSTSDGTKSRARGYLKDLLPNNGYNVYFKLETWTSAGSCLTSDYTSCTAQFYYYAQGFSGGTKETWNQNYWSPRYTATTGVNSSANVARADMYVSESNNFGDPYGGPEITKINHY